MRLRGARPDDDAFVAGLVPRFVEHGVAGGHTPDEVIDGTRRVLADALRAARPDELFLIAETDDGPAGFVYAVTERDFFTDEPYAHISEIAVERSGEGVGTRLLEAAESWARERGCRIVTLNVVDENRAGARLYERLGYGLGHHHYVKRMP